MKFINHALCLTILAILPTLNGCDQSKEPHETITTPAPATKPNLGTSQRQITRDADGIHIVDDLGRKVTLATTPKRIAAAVPAAVEVLCLLEKPPVIRLDMPEDRIYPQSAKPIPAMHVGHAVGPNLEQLTQAKPDLVILSPTFASFLPGIKKLGIDALVYSVRSIDDVPTLYKHIGTLVEADAKANELASQMQLFIDSNTIASKDDGPKVFALFGMRDSFNAFMPQSYLGSMVRTLGGKMVTQDAVPVRTGSSVGSFSMENIVASAPDVIIVISHGQDSNISEKLATNPLWGSLDAVKQGRVYTLSEWLFLMNPGPRMTDALPKLKALMYPES
ncbi:MAG: ABC transporter substrate-binding protein [Phycisphaeraceae bacterium JB051]